MRDGLVLRAVKRVALWGFRANLAAHRALLRSRGERPWTLGGGCRRSGGCCEAPALSAAGPIWSMAAARRLFLAWHRRVNGFELVSADARARVFVFRCSHFDRATRSCDSYGSRPGMCRDYPRILMWQPSPEMLPGCGYRAMPPNAAGLRAALDEVDLTPRQREALRKGLRLDG
jgi:Fe-S-cluster containining protein